MINPKTAGVGGGGASIWPPSLWFFEKFNFWREDETLVFCDF